MKHLAVIVVFNTDAYLQKQIDLFREFVIGDIAVIDNSSDRNTPSKIKRICTDNKIEYIKTATYEGDFSRSHAFACNTAINLYRKDYDSLLLCDHDIFPLKHVEIQQYDKYLLGGIHQMRKSPKFHEPNRVIYNYMWPGLLFLNTLQLKEAELDMMPTIVSDTFLDTGGQLYKIINGKPDRICYFEEKHMETEYGNYALIENGWMHFLKGSNWNEDPNHEKRINHLMKILESNIHV